MSDHDAFLRAICENPRDDLPRLVYADWLEERGQPDRARFIRTDVEMARLDEFDAGRLRFEARREADPVHKELRRELSGRLPGGLTWHGPPVIRRGFPWAVTAPHPNEFLKRAADVRDRFPVEHLILHVPLGFSVGRLAGRQCLDRLSRLSILGGNAGPKELAALLLSPELAGLDELALDGCGISAGLPQLFYFSVLPRLAGFSLSHPPVNLVRGVAEGLALCPPEVRLCDLDLTGAAIRPPVLERMLAADVFRRLRRLTLRDVPLREEGFRLLSRATTLSGLTVLGLGNTTPTAGGIHALASSPVLGDLRHLDLARNHIDADRARLLAESPVLAGIRVLSLADNALGNAGAAALATSPHLSALLVLRLSHCQVGDDGARALLDSPLADQLVLLDLAGSPMSGEMKQAVKDRFGDRVRI